MAYNTKYHTEYTNIAQDRVRADRLCLNGSEYFQAVFNGEIVFNRPFYYLSIADTIVRFTAKGGEFSSEDILSQMRIECYKQDIKGKPQGIEDGFSFEPKEIEKNETTNVNEGEFKVTHIKSGLSVIGAWRQNADTIIRKEYRSINVTGASYANIPAKGGTTTPTIYYTAVYVEVYESGKEEAQSMELTATDIYYVEGSVKEPHVTLDRTSGEIEADSLFGTRYDYDFPIVEIYKLEATDVNGNAIIWDGTIEVMQAKNLPSYGATNYEISSYVTHNGSYLSNNAKIGGEEITIEVHVSAWSWRHITWDSLYEEDDWNWTYANIDKSHGSTDYQDVYGDEIVTWTIPKNKEDSERNVWVNVYNMDAGYDVYHRLKQQVYVPVISWSTPSLDGDVNIVIPANGSAVAFIIPVVQYKYKDDEIEQTYRWNASVVEVVGHAVEQSGATFSNGYISCDSRGRYEEPSREAYYAERVWVMGQNDTKYEVDLNGEEIIITQAENNAYHTHSDILSISANPTEGIANTGGTSTISYDSRIKTDTYYDADPIVTTSYQNQTASLTTTIGTIASSVSGKGTTKLTIGENDSLSARTAVVKLSISGKSVTCNVKQDKAEYVFSKETTTLDFVSPSGGDVILYVISTKNKKNFAIYESNVGVSNTSIASVKSVEAVSGTTGKYKIVVSVVSNTGGERSFSVTATQPYSQYTQSWNVTQTTGIQLKTAWFDGAFNFAPSLNGDGNNYKSINVSNATMSAVGDEYKGGICASLTFKVVSASHGEQSSLNLGDVSVTNNSTTNIDLGVGLSNPNGYSDVYIEMWYDGKLQGTYSIMKNGTSQVNE